MNKLLLLMLVFSVCIMGNVAAQKRTVTGVVKSNDDLPMVQTTVNVKGTKNSVVCDNLGRFKIDVLSDSAILVFTQVGYFTKELPVSGKMAMEVILVADPNVLGDVVVVGYGTQRKKDVTVAIEKVNMKDLSKAPVRSFDEALAGRVSGVQVTSSDGQPGSANRITIRGNNSITQDNSPLYIIDGFPLENPNNNVINPNDIESIEILKDASATAIYGSRGSNGVIMITTKKGKEGPAVISINSSYGIQNVINRMEMMTPYDFIQFQIERDTSTISGSPTDLYLTSPGKTLDSYKTEKGIDWQALVLKPAAMQNHSISISGGSANSKYAISGSILDQDGVIINSNYSRYQGRVVLDQVINKKLKTGVNANYSYLKQSGVAPSESINSGTRNVMYSVWGMRPISPNGSFDIIDELFDPVIQTANDYRINPVLHLNNAVLDNLSKNLIVNAYAEYSILPELKLKVTGGINSTIRRVEEFNNSKTQRGNPVTSSEGVNGSLIYSENNSWLNENILSWNKRFKKAHSLNLVGVYSMQRGKSASFGSSANFLPNESAGVSGLDEGTPVEVASTSSNWSLMSFAIRGAYNFKSKYYLTASYRADGSSRFAKDKRWGYFPSASLAWKFSNENFMKRLNIFSDAKLRIGYGANGNNRVNDFAYMSAIGLPMASAYTINNSPVRGSNPISIGNPNLKWETTSETNIGLDLSVLKNRVTLITELYEKTTKDLLLFARLPLTSGYTSAFKNIGSVQNRGLELTINTVNLNKKNVNWNTSFNISFNRNKVLALTEGQESLVSGITWDNNWQSLPAYIAKIGQPLGLLYGYIWEGVYQYNDFYQNSVGTYVLKDEVATNGNVRGSIQPGDIKYKDLNGDGVVNSGDYTIIGNGMPKHTGGINNNFTYKQFDVNIFFQWSYGNDIQNANRIVFEGNALTKTNLNQFASYIDRWSPTNTSSMNFRNRGFFGGGYSTRTVEDGSYIRLKTAAIGYSLSDRAVKRLKIKSCRFYVSGQNLLTWTNYSGVDPEVNTYNSALSPGFDYSPYPRARTITFGVNLNL